MTTAGRRTAMMIFVAAAAVCPMVLIQASGAAAGTRVPTGALAGPGERRGRCRAPARSTRLGTRGCGRCPARRRATAARAGSTGPDVSIHGARMSPR